MKMFEVKSILAMHFGQSIQQKVAPPPVPAQDEAGEEVVLGGGEGRVEAAPQLPPVLS